MLDRHRLQKVEDFQLGEPPKTGRGKGLKAP
jgi:hypothetical protein